MATRSRTLASASRRSEIRWQLEPWCRCAGLPDQRAGRLRRSGAGAANARFADRAPVRQAVLRQRRRIWPPRDCSPGRIDERASRSNWRPTMSPTPRGLRGGQRLPQPGRAGARPYRDVTIENAPAEMAQQPNDLDQALQLKAATMPSDEPGGLATILYPGARSAPHRLPVSAGDRLGAGRSCQISGSVGAGSRRRLAHRG